MNNLPDAYKFFDSSFGKVVPFEEIQADPDSYSSVFCEGSVAMRQLLRELWEHGVETRGCCKGHECVHYYVKDSLRGEQKFIDEKTYRAHASSSRYHEYVTEEHAYIAFVPERMGDAQDICNRIEDRMKAALPSLSYATNAFPELVTISLNEYVPPPQREQFFTVLSSVLHRELLHENSPQKHSSLNVQIRSAQLQSKEINNVEREKKEFERSR